MDSVITLNKSTLKAILLAMVQAPNHDNVMSIMEEERIVNPHGDFYKPKRHRSYNEIVWDYKEEQVNIILSRSGY